MSNFKTIGPCENELLMIQTIFTARFSRAGIRNAYFFRIWRVTCIKFREEIDQS